MLGSGAAVATGLAFNDSGLPFGGAHLEVPVVRAGHDPDVAFVLEEQHTLEQGLTVGLLAHGCGQVFGKST